MAIDTNNSFGISLLSSLMMNKWNFYSSNFNDKFVKIVSIDCDIVEAKTFHDKNMSCEIFACSTYDMNFWYDRKLSIADRYHMVTGVKLTYSDTMFVVFRHYLEFNILV